MKYLLVLFSCFSFLFANAQIKTKSVVRSLDSKITIYYDGEFYEAVDNAHNVVMLDSISDVIFLDSVNCFFAKEIRYYFDEGIGEYTAVNSSSWNVYNFSLNKLVKESIELDELPSPDQENKLLIRLPKITLDRKSIILKTDTKGYGVVDSKVGLIIPFKYYSIEISDDQLYFYAYNEDLNSFTTYDRQGKVVPNK